MHFQRVAIPMDGEPKPRPGGGDGFEHASILADERQRRLLSILRECSRPIPASELAVRLAARESGMPKTAVTEADCQPIRADLRHRCLPKLEAVGWVDEGSDGVAIDSPLSIGTAELSLPDLRNPDHPDWEPVSVLLERPYRQEIVTILAEQSSPITLSDLATELLACDPASSPRLPDDRQSVRVSLHHADLPKLAAVGLVEYDPDEKTVARTRRLRTFADRIDLETG